jgi:hypothetical protein
MSLPGGRCNRQVLAACQKAGYKTIFTSVPTADGGTPQTTVGRLNVRADMTATRLAAVFDPGSGDLESLQRQYRIKAAVRRVIGDGLYDKLWYRLNHAEPDERAATVA